MASHNRNPNGNNQHMPVPSAEDPILVDALTEYHRQGLSSNEKISKLLRADYGIQASASTVKRRRGELKLYGPRSKKQTLTVQDKEQIVLQQLDQDPRQGQGLSTIKNHIAYNQGIHLTQDCISEVMHTHAPQGFITCAPGAKSIPCNPKVPLGIHERWAADGHDKLYRIGFPIWAIVDDAQGKWLNAWVVPSNRMGDIIGYLALCNIEKYKGLPLQFTTDCGSETVQLFGLINAINEICHPEWDRSVLLAHVYLRSVHNISIERSWLRMRLDMGDNAVFEYEKGPPSGYFNTEDPLHKQLSQWLWSRAIQAALNDFMAMRNAFAARKDNNKAGPSGCSRNESFSLHQEYGLKNCLLPLTDGQLEVIAEIKEYMGGEQLLAFVTPEFAALAGDVYDALGVTKLTIYNAWHVFEALLPLLQ